MDPNANLQAQERILERRAEYAKRSGKPTAAERDDARRLRELRDALGEWCSRGGFQPDWKACPRAAKYYGRN